MCSSTRTRTVSSLGLTDHLPRILVVAQTLVRRETQPARRGPLAERHLDHDLRRAPDYAVPLGRLQRLIDRRLWPAQRLQQRTELPQRGVAEAAAYLPGVPQRAVLVIAEH